MSRFLSGPFNGHLAIFADMKPRERAEVLLRLLGGELRAELTADAIAPLEAVS